MKKFLVFLLLATGLWAGPSTPINNAVLTGTATVPTGATLAPTGSGAITATVAPVAGLTGAGAGVLTALSVNVGTAGSPVVNGGALGTPASGTVTNLTGTASININGTVGNSTPAAGTFTSITDGGLTSGRVPFATTGGLLTDSGALTFSAGTLSATTFAGAFSGTATNATNIGITDDTATNATMYPVWVTATTGSLPANTSSTKLAFNPSTGILTANSIKSATGQSLLLATLDTNTSITLLPQGSGQVLIPSTSTLPTPQSGFGLQIGPFTTIEGIATTPSLQFRRTNTSAASPSPILSGNSLMTIGGKGYMATAYSASTATISFSATQNWTDSANGTNVTIGTTANGATSAVNSLVISGGASVTLTGGGGNMTIAAGAGNSRTLTLQSTTSGGTATNFLVGDSTQGVTLGSLAGTGTRLVQTDANGLLSATSTGTTTALTRVSTQFDKTNTTLANVTGLTATLAASTSYNFRAVLHLSLDATGGQKVALSGTCTAANIIAQVNSVNNTTNLNIINARLTALDSSTAAAGGTTDYTTIEGVITTTNAGTFTVQFAESAAAGTGSVLVGSTFAVTAF